MQEESLYVTADSDTLPVKEEIAKVIEHAIEEMADDLAPQIQEQIVEAEALKKRYETAREETLELLISPAISIETAREENLELLKFKGENGWRWHCS